MCFMGQAVAFLKQASGMAPMTDCGADCKLQSCIR